VPFLILFATVLFVSQGIFRRFFKSRSESSSRHGPLSIFMAILFQLGVAIYGGYFGAGIGILMLASLGFIGLSDIFEMNTLKTILAALINLVAAIWFIYAGLINWPKAATMTIGALIGYFLGSHYSQKIPQQQLRRIISGIGFTISAVTFYKQFVR
jgi:uncharacterized membrane protein YfcA